MQDTDKTNNKYIDRKGEIFKIGSLETPVFLIEGHRISPVDEPLSPKYMICGFLIHKWDSTQADMCINKDLIYELGNQKQPKYKIKWKK
ncbi:hypothetical protein [Candidatus Lokiarchaeum ossiferum]|uniref:hypothetical protein n=1 Tax=Candidatus Lokiarchaeum ossiferum TaxID=2951803 RepID=UPI00352F0817